MNHPINKLITRQRVMAGALALATFMFIGAPQQAAANTTAEAKIVNLASVQYTDASGNNTFNASATATINVLLVPAALTAGNAPTAADGKPGANCLVGTDTESGEIISVLYALTANANGADTYNIALTTTTPNNVSNVTINWSTLTFDGTVDVSGDPADRLLGSAIPVDISGTDTLLFPGGTNLTASFATNDIVVINTDGGNRVYLVDTVNNGVAEVATVGGTIAGSKAGETKASIKFKAYANQTILGQTVGGGVSPGTADPAFSTLSFTPTMGVPVGEMVLLQVDVDASNSTATDGTVDFTFTTDTAPSTNEETIDCSVGTWKATSLSITKLVKNITLNDAGYAASTDANPGNILEYQLTINNSGGLARAVVVTDDVPDYTTLVSFSDSYDGTEVLTPAGISVIFAQATNGVDTVDLTTEATTDEGEVASGDATANTAGSTMTFYVGTGSDQVSGGEVNAATNYTIIYQVKVD